MWVALFWHLLWNIFAMRLDQMPLDGQAAFQPAKTHTLCMAWKT